jgi:undecaprenyl-diphosphatase
MNWDAALFYAINGIAGRFGWLDAAMQFFAHPSPGYLGIVVAVALWAWWSWWESLFAVPTIASAVGIADAIGAQLKHLVERLRPCVTLPDVHLLGDCGRLFGFPSNHAINTAAMAAFLQALYPKTGWVSWPIVVLVGLARVYTGVHYPGDVMGGWLVGGIMGAGAAFLLLRWHRFRPVAPAKTVPASDHPHPNAEKDAALTEPNP